MAKKSRKPRESTPNIDFSKPIDITKFGTSEDPCFGKLYNLSTHECKRCGDSELCSIIFGQSLNKERKKIEKTNAFKDTQKIPRMYFEKKKNKGTSFNIAYKLAKNKFDITKKEAREIWKSLK